MPGEALLAPQDRAPAGDAIAAIDEALLADEPAGFRVAGMLDILTPRLRLISANDL